MFEKLWNAQPTAAKRRVHFTFRDSTTGDNKDPGSLTGKKASVRLDGTGTLMTTTNDVVALNQTDHLGAGYIEFTAAEFTALVSGELIISVSGITGVKVEDAQATLFTFDPNDPGATAAQIAAQVRTELTTELADVIAIKAKTDNLPTDPADESLIIAATDAITAAIGALPSGTAIADAIAARHYRGGSNVAPTFADALAGGLLDFTISGTTLTVKHPDDGTTAFTRTLTRDQTLLLGAILGAS